MSNDFKLIIKKFTENHDIRIYPIADIHLGAEECMEREWGQFCNDVLNDPYAYITLGGDLINNSTRNSVGNGVYRDIYSPREQKRRIAEALMPLRDRILCGVEGNHEARSSKESDDSIMYDIFCKLDLEHIYREHMAFVKIQIDASKNNGTTKGTKNPTYVLCVTHGSGGGMTGASVNRNEKYGYMLSGVDALITGHCHKPFVTQPSRINVDSHNNRITLVPFKVCSATSWLTYGGYAMQKMLMPSSFAPQVMTLSGDHKEIKVTM